MILFWTAIAIASPQQGDPPPSLAGHLDGWEEVYPDSATDDLGGASELWVPLPGGCKRAQAEADGVRIQVCSTPEESCEAILRLDKPLHPSPTWTCSHVDGWGRGGASSPTGPPVTRITSGSGRVVWADVQQLRVAPVARHTQTQPCSTESGHVESPDVWKGYRTCMTGRELKVQPVQRPGERMGGVTLELRLDAEPVDCREPCPEHEGTRALQSARTWLEGRFFRRTESLQVFMARDEQTCETLDADAFVRWLDLPDDLCTPPMEEAL